MKRALIALGVSALMAGSALAQTTTTQTTAAQNTATTVAPLPAPPPLTPAQQMQLDLERYRSAYEQEAARTRDLTADRDRWKTQAEQATATLSVCREKNDQLQALTAEVLDAYGSVKMLDVIGKMEPFLGLKRVQLENIVQTFGDRAYGLRCDARAAAPTESAPETATTPAAGS
ncbi:MAG: hypothetical protein QE280_03515 [Caulobacter sp.]|jgi:hypothetical protein|nr:hypothetical protein [Caulobacter sp.]